jgi:hypothetical protein
MKRRKDGSFTLSVTQKPGQFYRFRYFLDGARWENKWTVEAYVPNEFGSDDYVVNL